MAHPKTLNKGEKRLKQHYPKMAPPENGFTRKWLHPKMATSENGLGRKLTEGLSKKPKILRLLFCVQKSC